MAASQGHLFSDAATPSGIPADVATCPLQEFSRKPAWNGGATLMKQSLNWKPRTELDRTNHGGVLMVNGPLTS